MNYKQFIIEISRFSDRIGLRGLNRNFKIWFFRTIGLILKPKPVSWTEQQRIAKILIVKQHNQMGDMLCSTPLFTTLRRHFPGAHLTLVAGEPNFEVVHNHPDLDEVLEYQKLDFLSAPVGFWKFFRKLRKTGYELAVVPATVSNSVTSDLICWLSGATYRLGVSQLDGAENPSAFLFNIPMQLDWRGTQRHQVERNLDLLKGIGIQANYLPLSIGLSGEDEQFAEDFYQRHCRINEKVIGFHPGAGKIANQWGAQNFARVANELARKYHFKIFITCGPSDEQVVKQMSQAMEHPFVICKNMSIKKLAAILKKMALYITNDTGTMHIASAVGVPTLSLFGPTDPWQWAPKGEQHRFIKANDGQVTSIPVRTVLQEAEEFILKMISSD